MNKIFLLRHFVLIGVAAGTILSAPQPANAADPNADEMFCGSNAPSANGYVESSEKTCSGSGLYAAKTDDAGTILCNYTATCIPATPDMKATIKTASGKNYDDLSDDERYKIINTSGAYFGTSFPSANVMCRVKTDPCKPKCPSIGDCANPKKNGSVKVMRLLPLDGTAGSGIDTVPGGRVIANPKNSKGSIQ